MDEGMLNRLVVFRLELLLSRNFQRFIEYFTRRDAEKAIRTLDGRRLLGNEVRVVGWEVGICASSVSYIADVLLIEIALARAFAFKIGTRLL